MKPLDKNGYDLLHNGAIALAEVESAGIRVDVEYLNSTITGLQAKIAKATTRLKESKVWNTWKKKHRHKSKLSAGNQLTDVFFNCLGFEGAQYTEPTPGHPKGQLRSDKEVLRSIDHPFVRRWEKMNDQADILKRLKGLQREVVDGFFHASFNLHTASTFRSSSGRDKEDFRASSEWNFQNIPTRDDTKASVIRPCFIPRKGHRLGNLDYKTLEVKIGVCYHEDPAMIRYTTDPKTDMHRDASMDCFMLKKEQVSKPIRDSVKNAFVFASFYGSFFKQTAKGMWDWMEELDLKTEDGIPLKKHLESKGIYELGPCKVDEDYTPKKGTFERHIQKAEEVLWQKRFPVYKAWRDQRWEEYQKRAYFTMFTGFLMRGVFVKNMVTNYPIQGAAFHCLLWSLTKIVKWLKKSKMRTKIVGQIHDSLVPDIYEPEMEDFLGKALEVMTEDIRRHWDWIIVPLTVEVDVCPLGGNWYQKEKVKL